MVFCKLIEVLTDKAVYAIGGCTSDLTGKMWISRAMDEYEIEKWPDESKVYRVHVERLLRKYSDDFKKGVFPEKLAYVAI